MARVIERDKPNCFVVFFPFSLGALGTDLGHVHVSGTRR